MIIYNIPEEITMDNAAGIIIEQNPEIPLKNWGHNSKIHYSKQKEDKKHSN